MSKKFQIVFFCVALTSGVVQGQGPSVCYDELDYSCETLHPDASLFPCNETNCTGTHVLNADGSYKVVGGYYEMTYACPSSEYELLRQTGNVKSCQATQSPDLGDYETVGTSETIYCYKKRTCLAACVETSDVEDNGETPPTRIARCASDSGGALVASPHIGIETSQPCAGADGLCPVTVPEP